MRSRPLRAIVWLLAVLVSAAGIWISYDLAAQHLRIPREQPSVLEEACTAFETSSCQKVSDSSWGRFPFGAPKDKPSIPTAELGLCYFTFVLCWLLFVGGCSRSRWWAHLILAIGTALGLGSSGLLEYLMWFKLYKEQGFWCPLCLSAHIGSLLLFVFTLLLWPRKRRPAPVVEAPAPTFPPVEGQAERTSEPLFVVAPPASAVPLPAVGERPWPPWWVLAVTPMIAILATASMHFHLLWQSDSHKYEEARKQQARYEALFYYEKGKTLGDLAAYLVTPRIEIPVEGEPFRGPANAKHTIVIFSDFECPVCGKFEEWFDQYIEPAIADPRVGGVKVIFKHWPICTECNEYAVVTSHPSACKAARAAEAARIVGGDQAFWKMHDLLFKRRDEWKKSESFVELAREIGLDENAFSQAMDSPDAIARIKRHAEEGEKLAIALVEQDQISENMRYWIKVHSTPSIYIDNKRLYTRGKTETWYKILGYNPPEGPSSTRPNPATTRPGRAAPPRPAPPRR